MTNIETARAIREHAGEIRRAADKSLTSAAERAEASGDTFGLRIATICYREAMGEAHRLDVEARELEDVAARDSF
jgi:hypothetical protein